MKAKRLLSTLLSAAVAFGNIPALLFVKADDIPDTSIKECIKNGFENFDTEIDISGYKYSSDKYEMIVKMIGDIFEEPDMFFLATSSLKFKQAYNEDGNLILSKIVTEYENDRESADVVRAEFEAKTDNIIRENITKGMTDIEKALRLHDYLVLNTAYDLDNSIEDYNGGYSAYDVIVKNNGVCKGYAQAYKYLLEKVGISSVVVISEDMVHGWNLVEIDGNWYHVDVTWDDPVPDTPGRVNHAYFMLSDEAIGSESEYRKNKHYNWECKGIKADDKSYDNMFWNSVQTEIIISSDNWYFVSGNGEYSTFVPETNEVNTNVSLYEEPWYVWGEPGRLWTGKYTSIIISDDTIYYNTPTSIYKMKLDGSWKQQLAYVNPIENDGYMYGLVLKDNELFAVVKQAPSSPSKQIKIMDLELKKYSFIESMLIVIEEMNEGDKRSFNMDGERVLPARALELMKGRNVEITLDYEECSWKLNGQNVTAARPNDIDLKVEKNQGIIPKNSLESVADSQMFVEINLANDSDLGITADLLCNVGSAMAGKDVAIYRYDEEENTMDKVEESKVDKTGGLVVPLNNASNYAVVVIASENPDAPVISEGRSGSRIITASGFVGLEDPQKEVTGDVSGDGSVDLTDLTLLSQYLLGEINLNEEQLKNADVNGNGKVEITDMAILKQYIMKDLTTFPVEV